ncbi:MAG: response regulator [Nitrospirae bacterium]|nr:MAG: response regulator [Nitrospirota bacterium]
MGYAEIALSEIPEGHPIQKRLEIIYNAGQKAKALTQQLLAFSRKQISQPEVVNLNEIIKGLEDMLCRMIGEDIYIEFKLSEDLSPVRADRAQMEQVLMNLAVNARDAMPEGGLLNIETKNLNLTEEYSEKNLEVTPGEYVVLTVTDTGVGMDREVMEKIFEPFFTTKKEGKGTGLGLSTVYGIVKNHGGHITVYSEPGEGTTFRIYLPAVEGEAEEYKGESKEETISGGNESLILVEDNEDVRSFASEALKMMGYRVYEFSSPLEAIEFIETNQVDVKLLITDLVMPEMSGRDLAERLSNKLPELKVLYMSGYTDDTVVRYGILKGQAYFISKPFTVKEIAKKVRQVLDNPR